MASYGTLLISSLQAKHLYRNSLCATLDLTKAVATRNIIMNPVTMDSGTPTEFLLFPDLPPELRQMVWDEALPTLGLQRFKAEIKPHPDSTIKCPAKPFSGRGNLTKFFRDNSPKNFVLCLTPNDDFVQLTSGYRGLLGACHESRGAAMARIKCHLSIYYTARNADGSFTARSARVPFNPDGHICISDLVLSFDIPKSYGDGAREHLAEFIQCPALNEMKNLVISVNLPRDSHKFVKFMLNWPYSAFENMARRMNKLETVAMVDERVLNDQHPPDAKGFVSLRNPRVIRARDEGGDLNHWHELDDTSISHPWLQLVDDFIKTLRLTP